MAYPETIFATNDLDGVHFKAPFPGKTLKMLWKKDPNLVPHIKPELVEKEARTGIQPDVQSFLLGLRRFNPEGKPYLEALKKSAERHDRDLKIAVLTGRTPEYHEVTKRRVSSKYGNLVDYYFLNNSTSATSYKETVARRIIEAGNTLVHIDDDLRVALRLARIDDYYDDSKVLVYLVNNKSNKPWLLERAGVELPHNVVRVNSLTAASHDFNRRLRLRVI